jgi:hypothetical protein
MSTRTIGVEQIADELGVSEEWVRRQCRAGRFPHHRIARRLRFTDADLAAILAVMAVPVTPLVTGPGGPETPAAPARRRYAVYPR